MEQPIAFFNRVLRDFELKYNVMEKQAYALVKTLKDFRVYILHSLVITYVSNTVAKDILTQLDSLLRYIYGSETARCAICPLPSLSRMKLEAPALTKRKP